MVEFPKMLYKSLEEYKIVQNVKEQEFAQKEGWKTWEQLNAKEVKKDK